MSDNNVQSTHMFDLTPKWEGLVPGMIAVIENGTLNGKKVVYEELLRMAKAADLWNESQKRAKKLG